MASLVALMSVMTPSVKMTRTKYEDPFEAEVWAACACGRCGAVRGRCNVRGETTGVPFTFHRGGGESGGGGGGVWGEGV